MSEDLSDLINNVKNMVDSGNIPDNVKSIINNLNNSAEVTDISNSGSSYKNKNSTNLNLDMDTILKLKNVMDNINQTNDPRANLLNSLKPYLRDSKRDKLDQYVNLLNISKIAEIMNNNKKENNGNA